jgi:hypothetical protein
MHDKEEVIKRMKELFEPIDRQIMMTDSKDDVLMLASIMMSTARGMYESILGVEKTKILLKGMVEDDF